jgi:hypothetical protein
MLFFHLTSVTLFMNYSDENLSNHVDLTMRLARKGGGVVQSLEINCMKVILLTIKILIKIILREDTHNVCLLGPGREAGRNNQGRIGHCGYRGRGHTGRYCGHQHWSQVIMKKFTDLQSVFKKVFIHGKRSYFY